MSYYIGLDAHTATCMFVTLDSEGKAVSNLNCATTEGNLLRYVRSHQGRKKLVFEESHLAQWLYLLLKDEVNELVVCNPLYLGKKQGSKTDSRDAWHLANELRCGHVIPVFHADHPLMELRCLVEAYNDLVQDMTRAKNRYKALFRSQGLATAGSMIYKQPERMKELSFESERFAAEKLFEQIAQMNEIKAAYSKRFKLIAKQHKSIRNLCSIPGFDVIRSATVAALVCSPERFKNKHKFWAYAMLVKQERVSDGKTYGKVTIWGRRSLKCVFDGAAQSVLRGNSSLRKYYDRLHEAGLEHKKAKKAVARRIAAISLALLKCNQKYEDKYEQGEKRLKK